MENIFKGYTVGFHRVMIDSRYGFINGLVDEMKKLAICVPYRNRKEHLDKFVPYIANMLEEKNIEYSIYICNQVDKKPFNRGKLLNIAFKESVKHGCDYFAFHDIDMLPHPGADDYSYPVEYPIHLSTIIDEYDFKLPYAEYFGGCVMFAKEQFEKINGFSNEYWGWGNEDDDLFWRCKINNLIDVTYSNYNLGERSIVKFNGKNSYLQINASKSIENIGSDNSTISFIVKSNCLKNMIPFIYGDENSEYVSTPLLTRCGFDLITYCNSQVYNCNIWDTENSPKEVWAKSEFGKWINLAFIYNSKKSYMELYVNGIKKQKLTIKKESRKYYKTPFFIGKSDVPVWNYCDTSFFRGSIAEICFWDRALDKNEIKKMHSSAKYIPINNGLKLHYDFVNINDEKVMDISGNENHGELVNAEIKYEEIGKLINLEQPFRRMNKYSVLPHKKQGVIEGKFVQEQNSTNNAKTLINKILSGDKTFCKTGLNDLEYEITNKKEINSTCIMLDVKL